MRCLTLADFLAHEYACECHFICRPFAGNLLAWITARGHQAHAIQTAAASAPHAQRLSHSSWLPVSPSQDAQECLASVATLAFDAVVVDHYALDFEWECLVRASVPHIMVIDDLADRDHDCDLLLDQTYGRQPVDYQHLVPPNTRLLCGTAYSLLRPGFSELRQRSLDRRQSLDRIRHVLIAFGGMDPQNHSAQVLESLATLPNAGDLHVEVLIGPTAPHLDHLRQFQARSPFCSIQIHAGIDNVQDVLYRSDFAFGAAGSSAWERCCLGVPTLQFQTANNQALVVSTLNAKGAVLGFPSRQYSNLLDAIDYIFSLSPADLRALSQRAAEICDGAGTRRTSKAVIDTLTRP